MSEVTDGRSRQLRIADDVRARIEAGDYPPGSRLPSLPELAAEFGVSLVTVRLALARLRQEGLIVSQQGTGNFVRTRPPLRRYGIGRYGRSVWAGDNPQPLLIAEGNRQGAAVDQETSTERVPAPAFVAERLPGVAEGDPVYVRRRTTSIDGVINQAADSYFTLATAERYSTSRKRSQRGCRLAQKHPACKSRKALPSSKSSAPTTPQTDRSTSPDSLSAPTWQSSTTASPSRTSKSTPSWDRGVSGRGGYLAAAGDHSSAKVSIWRRTKSVAFCWASGG
jgi:GntR family transcriptional regulator